MKCNDLVKEYDSLIKSIAHKFYGVPFEDLYQVGFIGLMKAKKNYQANDQCSFSSYAYKYIFGEMYYLVLSLNSFKVSKNTIKIKKLIDQTKDKLIQVYEREVTDQEIIKVLKIDYDDYLMASLLNNNALSLDYESDEESNFYNYLKDNSSIDKEALMMLKEGLEKLDDKSKNIIVKRYFYDYSQQEIAAMYGMSQTSVSRCEKKLINQLNQYIA